MPSLKSLNNDHECILRQLDTLEKNLHSERRYLIDTGAAIPSRRWYDIKKAIEQRVEDELKLRLEINVEIHKLNLNSFFSPVTNVATRVANAAARPESTLTLALRTQSAPAVVGSMDGISSMRPINNQAELDDDDDNDSAVRDFYANPVSLTQSQILTALCNQGGRHITVAGNAASDNATPQAVVETSHASEEAIVNEASNDVNNEDDDELFFLEM